MKSIMQRNREVLRFNLLVAWLALNLFSAAVFITIAIREISLRDYPGHDPFFVDRLVDPYADLFLPMVKTPIIAYGILTGSIVFLLTRSLWAQRSKLRRRLVTGCSLLLAIVSFWGGILFVNWMAENLECELVGGTLFGCWQSPELQQWHMVIGGLGIVGVLILGLPLIRAAIAAAPVE